ncbi:MAG: class I SAM-dependent methyltransferase [Prevotella sp.]|nr:class I SAM-dependent methyltransferase [Prevotella sp.]
MKDNKKADYGNWVPTKLLALLSVLSIGAAAMLIVSVCCHWSLIWTALFGALFCVALFFYCYMAAFHHAFSFGGGGMMGTVLQYVVAHLPWDGQGRLLDVGCGAGALTIRCAKAFPQAHCTGIDYWGVKWDYSQKMCQRNAEAEGVASRCEFQQGDANHLDFADETFDAVVSNFVYHEVNDGKSKEELLRETLRVLKKGGSFALQDMFGQKSIYGDFQAIVDRLANDVVAEIHYVDSTKDIPVPAWMQVPGMLTGVGIIYGRK